MNKKSPGFIPGFFNERDSALSVCKVNIVPLGITGK